MKSRGHLEALTQIARGLGALIELPQGQATSSVLSNRVTYAFTPLMFFSGLVQYNSTARTVGSNLRFRLGIPTGE